MPALALFAPVKQLHTGARAADSELIWHLKWEWSGIMTAAEIATGHALTHAGCLLQPLLLLCSLKFLVEEEESTRRGTKVPSCRDTPKLCAN